MAEAALALDDPEARAAQRRFLLTRVVIYGLLGLFALVYLVPLLVVIFNSFRPLPEMWTAARIEPGRM